MSDIHEIQRSEANKIYVTSTVLDAVLEYNLENGILESEYWPREIPKFQNALNLTPLNIDKKADNRVRFLGAMHIKHPEHLHLNAIALWQGEVYALFHAFGVIANLSRKEIVLQDNLLKKGHNLIITEDGIAILNATKDHTVCFYDIRKKKLIKKLQTAKKELKGLSKKIEKPDVEGGKN